MFQPLSLFVGLRYVRARRHTLFVSFITWVSLAGVALGVAALIVVLSVMNGLKGELRERLLALSAHARIVDARPAASAELGGLGERLRRLPGVVGVAPYMDLQALAMHGSEMQPVTLRGIDPRREPEVTQLAPLLVSGRISALAPGSNRLILGEVLAEQLGVTVGDAITLLVPGVAAFNIVAMLVMVVTDKRTDIAILRTLGAAPGTVLRVFITQGLVIGWCGVAAGVGLGVLIAYNVTRIAQFLQYLFRFRFFDADVFYITTLPSQLHARDVLWISVAALLLTLAATVYPALRAAATPPAAALRYE